MTFDLRSLGNKYTWSFLVRFPSVSSSGLKLTLRHSVSTYSISTLLSSELAARIWLSRHFWPVHWRPDICIDPIEVSWTHKIRLYVFDLDISRCILLATQPVGGSKDKEYSLLLYFLFGWKLPKMIQFRQDSKQQRAVYMSLTLVPVASRCHICVLTCQNSPIQPGTMFRLDLLPK